MDFDGFLPAVVILMLWAAVKVMFFDNAEQKRQAKYQKESDLAWKKFKREI